MITTITMEYEIWKNGFKSYLNDRKKVCNVNDLSSNIQIKCSIPQGSCIGTLSPLLNNLITEGQYNIF